ncbi:MAG: hypothetical protein K2M42_01205 [Oscillospiraceae bacterium]|nr:hypothetical protein [Oscillospiraceae bacterium]
MSETIERTPGFTAYEYTEVTTQRRLESVYTDSYPSFGWQLEGSSTPPQGSTFVVLRFKRNRKLRNKLELSRLQRQFDIGVDKIKSLERSKVFQAAAVAYLVGVIGTAFMAGSVFCFLAGHILPSVTLAIPGFLGWIAPYLLYRTICKRKSVEVTPMIDQKYDEIYAVCEKASHLVQTA